MKRVMVQYKVKADKAEENIEFIQAVFAELKQKEPKRLKYQSMQMEDGLTFVHLAEIDGENPLQQMDSFKAFIKDIAVRCDEPPKATEFDYIGRYFLHSKS